MYWSIIIIHNNFSILFYTKIKRDYMVENNFKVKKWYIILDKLYKNIVENSAIFCIGIKNI